MNRIHKNFDLYKRVLKNRSLMTLWAGVSISMLGDCFFNLAVMWMIYSTSGSLFQTAIIQVVWHLDRVLIGPIAGAVSDRWDRRKIIIILNIVSGLIVALLASIMQINGGIITPVVIFCAVFVLNSLNTFLGPAMFAIIPDLVEKDALATQQGLFSSLNNVTMLAGGLLAGAIVSGFGSMWAIYGDAASFMIAALFVFWAKIPPRQMSTSSSTSMLGIIKDIAEGWREINRLTLVKTMLWLGLLINVLSMLGPLTVGLVDQQLHEGPFALGILDACAIIGAIIGGLLVGPFDKKIGAGKMLGIGWTLGGMLIIFEGISKSLFLTGGFELMHSLFMVLAGAAIGSVTSAIVPADFRGRVWGLVSSIGVISIPISSLIGGWFADLFGPGTIFVIGGIWGMGVGILALSITHVRKARIDTSMAA